MKHIITCGVVLIAADHIALVQEGKAVARGTWSLPSGRLEEGESLVECATREAAEETGLAVEPDRLVGVYQMPSDTGGIVVAFVFEATLDEMPALQPTHEDVLDAEWVPLSEVDSYDVRSCHTRPAIRDYEAGNRHGAELLTRFE